MSCIGKVKNHTLGISYPTSQQNNNFHVNISVTTLLPFIPSLFLFNNHPKWPLFQNIFLLL
jgi:hypothetical protein